MNPLEQQLNCQDYTILIVDDTPANLGVLFNFLDECGFEIMVAQDGKSGIEKAHYNRPDIILLDVLMPGLDGFDVCQRLKASEETQSIPIIFMTGLDSIEEKVKAFEMGAVDYVTKPFQKEELLARLQTHLRMGDLTRQLKDYQNHLEALVQQRTAELTETNQKLQQEMQERLQAEAEVRQQSQELRALTARLAEVEEAERRRLARELHDRVGQDLGTLDISLNILRSQIPAETAAIMDSRLDDSLELVKHIAKHVYDVMAELRSPVLDDYGLVAALNWYGAQFSERAGVSVTVRGDDNAARLPMAIESALLRITQEALSNVAKHSQAGQVSVAVEQNFDEIRLTITDDGTGFEPEMLAHPTQGRGWGIISMRERAEAIGGHCEIKTKPQQGTQIVVEVPL